MAYEITLLSVYPLNFFSMWCMLYQRKAGDEFFPECLLSLSLFNTILLTALVYSTEYLYYGFMA
jgi:hypothetical protein